MSVESTATAVTVFHPSPDAEHDGWLAELLDSARTAEGFVSGQVALAGSGLEPAVSVVFSAEALLHAWLDGPDRALALAGGREHGFWPCAADIVTVDGSPPPAGVAGFRHLVAADRGAEFLAAQIRLVAAARAGFTGFLGAALFPAGPGGEQLSIVRFRTERQLAEWLDSDQRRAALPELRSSLTREFTSTSQTTPFGTTVRADHGRVAMTPPWKTAMLVLMVLYPTVMLLSRFLGPALDSAGAQPWLSMWLSQVISIAAMQWWLMPAVSRGFGRWLDPVDGRGWRISAVGAAAVLLGYAVTLAVFATARGLQYWDYSS